jgi:hypothetical protein
MSLLNISTVCTSGEKRLTEKRKKALAKLASKLKKLLANSKFHSHLASWRVVISTPGVGVGFCGRRLSSARSVGYYFYGAC